MKNFTQKLQPLLIVTFMIFTFLGYAQTSATIKTTKDTFAYEADNGTGGDANDDQGGCEGIVIANETDYNTHSFIEFDLSSIPSGSVINSAELVVTHQNWSYWGEGGGNVTFSPRRIEQSWVEGNDCGSNASGSELNWGLQPSYTETYQNATGSASDADGTTYTMDVTSLVQGWIDGTFNNHGLALIPNSTTGDGYFAFYSETNTTNAPRLEITYDECTSGIDTDGDNVSDVCDLDSDNDGISDIDEGKCTVAAPTVFPTYDPDSTPDFGAVPEGWTIINGTTDISDQTAWGDGTEADEDTWTGRPVDTPPNGDPLWVSGYRDEIVGSTISNLVVGTTYEIILFSGNFVTDGDDYLRSESIDITIDGNVVGTLDKSTTPINTGWQTHTITFTASSTSELIEFQNSAGFQNGQPVSASDPGFIWNVSFGSSAVQCEDLDTDNDGTPDYLDLDSDGDGCSDANEYYENGNADGNADGTDDGQYGDSSTLTVDGDGLVTAAGYNGTSNGLLEARDDTTIDACVFIQTTDGNFNEVSNWREGAVPTFNNNATIAADVQSDVISNQEVNSLTLIQGTTQVTTINITDGFTLNAKGDITNNGEFTGDGEVVLDGTIAQNLFGDGEYENLRLNNSNGATVQSSTVINGVLYVDQGTFSTNNNTLFPCDFTATGHPVGQIGPVSGTITGEVKVEQCFPARRAFRFVSPSTTTTTSIHANWQEGATAWDDDPNPGYGTHITGLEPDPNIDAVVGDDQTNGLDWQPSGNASMFVFDSPNNEWDSIVNTNITLNAGDAYRLMIRGDRSVSINTADPAPTDTKLRSQGDIASSGGSDYDITINNTNNGAFNMIGNPYQAVVDMDLVINDMNATNTLDDVFYVWDPTLGGAPGAFDEQGGRGAYVAVVPSTGVPSIEPSETTGTTEMNQYLQPYQAFFVRNDSDNATTISNNITFKKSFKAVDQNQLNVFSDNNPQHFIRMNLYDAVSYNDNNTPDDGLSIYFDDNYSNAVDNTDALKFFNIDENLATVNGNTYLCIENRAMPQVDESIQLFTYNYRTTDYVLMVNVGSFPDNDVYLKDNYTGDLDLLNQNDQNTLTFSVDNNISTSVATDRFEIVFQETFGQEDFEEAFNLQIYPNPVTDNQFNILSPELAGKTVNMTIADLSGRVIDQQQFNSFDRSQTVKPGTALSTGVYLIKLESEGKQVDRKLIVE